jgi:hypothetical protein
MAAEFYDASDELIELAKKLIEDHHGHLIEANIKYLFRTGNWEVKKRDTWGQAKKVGKEVNFLTGHDFIVLIHQEVWEQLVPEHKEALLDHELQHCSAGTDDAGNKVWYIQGHDVEDFLPIIRRHGLWSPALKKIETALEMRNQTELDFGAPEEVPLEEMLALPGKEEVLALSAAEEVPAIAGRPQLKLISSNKEPKEESADVDYVDIEFTVDDTGTEV